LGFIILAVVFVVWLRAYKSIKGDDSALFSGSKRKPGDQKDSLEDFIAAYKRGEAPAAAVSPVPSIPSIPRAAPATVQAAPVKRDAFVSGATKLAYLACKAGLRDHHIFAHVPLSALSTGGTIDPSLLRSGVDILICNAAMSAVAAIDVIDAGNAATNAAKSDYLKALGIRHLRLSAKSLPRPDELHALLYKM
jgi:hypothetical protein